MEPVPNLSKIKKWRGFKLEATMSVKYVSPHKKQRLILFNPVFWQSINDYQRYFILNWCRIAHKTKDESMADKFAKKDYVKRGYDMNHILLMYSKMTHVNMDVKTGRMYQMLTDKLSLKEKFIRLSQKINAWLKKIFQKGK